MTTSGLWNSVVVNVVRIAGIGVYFGNVKILDFDFQ
jgi:hypothetical protein